MTNIWLEAMMINKHDAIVTAIQVAAILVWTFHHRYLINRSVRRMDARIMAMDMKVQHRYQ
jgi:hypothetical protein